MDDIPEGGVKELKETREGREYLAKLQKKHEIDLLQPSDPRFQKVYGDKLKYAEEKKHEAIRESSDMWLKNEDKKRFEQRKRGNPNRRYL